MAVALALLVGLATGALVAFLALVRPALAARDRRAADAVVLERELAAAEARLQASEASLGDRVREAVRDASADAYRQANTDFLELAGTKLEGTVAPLRESLTKVNDQVEALDRARAQSYGALRQQVEALSERAGSLANALRSSNVRGRWGEAQLRNVVEQAGLLEHCDFVAQASARDGEGDLLRPDLVVRIPGGKSVVVDAKVPLAAYLDAFETQDESARHELLRRHARQVRDHVTKLAGKAYQRQFAPAPDFVVMFVPDETLLRVAHEHDTRLSEDARASRVMLASPTTLMAIITTVAAIWQQETVAESARAVHSLGTELHKRLGTFAGHLARTGRALESAVGSYNEAVGSFESRVLVQARKLEQHGIPGELASPQQVERQARAV
ncbi:MAG TPA: DNA recombination protein RmuC, partial [Gaiellaceae bacterium]|nr:DNA recombination protein RmuC [Gaiellaceae bacterium]